MEINTDKRQVDIWRNHMIAAILLMAFAFFINRGIETKGLYMGDLYMWSCFDEQSFFEHVFPIGGSRFRFLFYLISWPEMAFIGTHVGWMVSINIILNGLVAITLYGMAWKLNRSELIGFLASITYLLSNLPYCQISQGLGAMEAMTLWMGIDILYCLFQFLHDTPKSRTCYVTAVGLYFGVCFIHERYMVLLPLFSIVLLLKKNRDIRQWIYLFTNFILVQVIRLLTIESLSSAGTDDTQVADTFSLKQNIKYALSRMVYMFGINTRPEHLGGIPWRDSPFWIYGLVYGTLIFVLAMVVYSLVTAIRHKENRFPALTNNILFICFIGTCIISSSVTIQVEMRWVYISYTAALLCLSYMYGVVISHVEVTKAIQRFVPYGAVLVAYMVLMSPVQTCYRGFYPKLYYQPNQVRYNSLAEETYEKYGDALFGKTVYILGSTYEISEFTTDTFFKVHDKKKAFAGPEVVFIDNIDEVGLVHDSMLILREDTKFDGFQDITQFARDLKCQRIYGYYKDAWMGKETVVKVMAGANGIMSIGMIYPGSLEGHETSIICMDGEEVVTVRLTKSVMHEEIRVKPGNIVELKFINNLYMKDTIERCREKRFSMLMNLGTSRRAPGQRLLKRAGTCDILTLIWKF